MILDDQMAAHMNSTKGGVMDHVPRRSSRLKAKRGLDGKMFEFVRVFCILDHLTYATKQIHEGLQRCTAAPVLQPPCRGTFHIPRAAKL
jgi:hypothetical protein